MNQTSWTDQWFRFTGDDGDEHPTASVTTSKGEKENRTLQTPTPAANQTQTKNHPEPCFSSTDKSAEILISEALKELSIEEREKVMYEVHGVADEIEESSDFIANKLEGLRNELSKLKNKGFLVNTKAFQLAEKQNHRFVYNRQFCLDFLRSDDYNTKDAAMRMVKFFDFKLDIFGESNLCKDLSLDDLEEEDMNILEKGFFQRLPQRDRAGRAVIVVFPAMMKYSSYKTMGRIMMTIIAGDHDETTRKKGGVLISYDHNDGSSRFTREPGWLISLLFRAKHSLPQKVVSIHHCFVNASGLKLSGFHLLQSMSDLLTRARTKIHTGTYNEIMYELMTYGIPHNFFPVSPTGKIETKHCQQMIEMHQNFTDFSKSIGRDDSKMVTLPGLTDVLLGKGKAAQQHPGNMRLHALVDQLLPEYNTLNSTDKTLLSHKVVQAIKPARFLSQECGVWMEVPSDVSREKVSHLFRARRKVFVKKQREQQRKRQQEQQQQQQTMVATNSEGGCRGRRSKSPKLDGTTIRRNPSSK